MLFVPVGWFCHFLFSDGESAADHRGAGAESRNALTRISAEGPSLPWNQNLPEVLQTEMTADVSAQLLSADVPL